MPTTPPGGIDPDIIGDELTRRVKANGKRSISERLDDIILLIEDARCDLKEIKKMKADISQLKRLSIMLWVGNHPKAATVMIVPLFVILFLHTIEYAPYIEKALAFISKWFL